jgi:hypothetical protein
MGEWAQNGNKIQTTLVEMAKEVYDFMTPYIRVSNLLFLIDQMV